MHTIKDIGQFVVPLRSRLLLHWLLRCWERLLNYLLLHHSDHLLHLLHLHSHLLAEKQHLWVLRLHLYLLHLLLNLLHLHLVMLDHECAVACSVAGWILSLWRELLERLLLGSKLLICLQLGLLFLLGSSKIQCIKLRYQILGCILLLLVLIGRMSLRLEGLGRRISEITPAFGPVVLLDGGGCLGSLLVETWFSIK